MKILLLFMTVFLTASAFGQTTAATEAEVYTDSVYPFSITVPKGWKKTLDSADHMQILAKSDNGAGPTNFNINARDIGELKQTSSAEFAKNMTVDDPKYFERITNKLLPGSEISASGKTTLGGREAIYVIFAGVITDSGSVIPLKFYVFQMLADGNLYTMTFTTGQDEFEKHYPVFKEIAASFKLAAKGVKKTP